LGHVGAAHEIDIPLNSKGKLYHMHEIYGVFQRPVKLSVDLDAVSANALLRLDRYINWADILKLTENDPEAAYAAERLHTVLQHMGQ
jgi:hypothetical protein